MRPLHMSSLSREGCFALTVVMSGAILLQGCGGGGSGGSTTTTTTITTTSTSSLHVRTEPLSVAEAVKTLNQQYMAYDFQNPNKTSPLGITISFAAAPDDFNKNLFCHPFMNTNCFGGFSDCRMSAALFNWKIASNDYIWSTTFGRAVGFVFNQTLVETSMGKCMYVFDGASENRLNNGCGLGAGSDCSKPGSAYNNTCPSTGKTCTADDKEVKGQMCVPDGPIPHPVKSGVGNQCFYSMPALNYPKTDRPNHLQMAVAARVADELKTGNYADHNELVIDERVLIPQIWFDPAVTIPAFVFAKSRQQEGRKSAEKMRDKFSQDYQVGKIPVIGVNDVTDFRPNGPFFAPEDLAEPEMVI